MKVGDIRHTICMHTYDHTKRATDLRSVWKTFAGCVLTLLSMFRLSHSICMHDISNHHPWYIICVFFLRKGLRPLLWIIGTYEHPYTIIKLQSKLYGCRNLLPPTSIAVMHWAKLGATSGPPAWESKLFETSLVMIIHRNIYLFYDYTS